MGNFSRVIWITGLSGSGKTTIANEVVSWLVRQEVSVIAMACNTTNSLAFDVVKETSGIPVVDLISSIAETIEDRKIGVLATPATAASGVYRQQIEYAYPGTQVWEQSCPSLPVRHSLLLIKLAQGIKPFGWNAVVPQM